MELFVAEARSEKQNHTETKEDWNDSKNLLYSLRIRCTRLDTIHTYAYMYKYRYYIQYFIASGIAIATSVVLLF